MDFSLNEIVTCFMVLFAIIDMPGNIPIIASLRKKVGHIQSGKATLVATAILLVFLFLGQKVLNLIGIDIPSFAVAGSIVVFIIALEMILGIEISKTEVESASIVPLAFPLIAGAGALTTVLSLKSKYHTENLIIAILLNMLLVYLILKFSVVLEKWLAPMLPVIKKFFGVILLAISIKLFTQNITYLLSNIP